MKWLVLILALCVAPAFAGDITLFWDDVVDPREQGYMIERTNTSCAAPGTFAEVARVGQSVVTFTDAGLPEGMDYCYRVFAFNPDAQSGPSNLAGKRLPFGVPSAVQNLRVQ